jgi:hypothetical protein
LYKRMPFSLQSIGPLKIAGLLAGLMILNIGVVAGFTFARRKRHPGIFISGVILTLSGLGGTLLSLFWDVLGKKKPFSADALGPFKMAGMLAGLAVLAAGALLLFLGRGKAKAREIIRVEPPQAKAQEEIPFALPSAQAEPPAAGNAPMEAIPVEETAEGALR